MTNSSQSTEEITKSVGNNRPNHGPDVLLVRAGLKDLNYRTDEDKAEDIFTRLLDGAIKAFQNDENLEQDGWLRPGGPTEERLKKRLKQSAAPDDSPLASTILPKLYDDDFVPEIQGWEGTKKKIYKDSKGYPTVGIGFILPNAEQAKTYPFYKMDGEAFTVRATAQEIESAYNKVKAMAIGQGYDDYARQTDIGLQKDDMTARFKQKLRKNVEELENKFDGFGDLPKTVQAGLLDMQYNMGDAKFQPEYTDPVTKEKRGWPDFFSAYQRHDFQEMARQSHRKDVQDDRNAKIRDWLIKAE